jgi:transcriptional regulator with XRE-family HTH domain
MAAEASRALRRKQLGSALRRLREASGVTREATAERLDCSVSKVGRMETGDVGVRTVDLEAMLELYGMSDPQVPAEELFSLARDSKKRGGWWLKHADLPRKYLRLIELESVATSIRRYDGQAVPDLLQTRDYARAIVRATCPTDIAEEIEEKVDVRMTRQNLLSREADVPPDTWFVLDEAVLHRQVGGRDVLRQQLLHLVALSEHPQVTLQVLPFEHGGHEATNGPFTILGFPRPDPEIVYTETFTGHAFLEEAADVEHCGRIFENLTEAALSPPKSMDFIRRIVRT